MDLKELVHVNKETESFNKKTNVGFRPCETVNNLMLSSSKCNGYDIVRISRVGGSETTHCVVTENGDILFSVKFLLIHSSLRDSALYNSIAADAIRSVYPFAFCSLYKGYRLVDTLYVAGAAMQSIIGKMVRDVVITNDSKSKKAADAYARFINVSVLGAPEIVHRIKSMCTDRVKVPRNDIQVRETLSTAGECVASSDGTFSVAFLRKYKADGKYMRVYSLQGQEANVSFVLSPSGTPLFRLGDMLIGPIWTAGMCSGIWNAIKKNCNIDNDNVYKSNGIVDGINHRAKYASSDLIMAGLNAYNPRTQACMLKKQRAEIVAKWLVEVSSKRDELDAILSKICNNAEKRRCTDANVRAAAPAKQDSQDDTAAQAAAEVSAATNVDKGDLFADLVDDTTGKTESAGVVMPDVVSDTFASNVLLKSLEPKIEEAKKAIADKQAELERITQKFELYKETVDNEIQELRAELSKYNQMIVLGNVVYNKKRLESDRNK